MYKKIRGVLWEKIEFGQELGIPTLNCLGIKLSLTLVDTSSGLVIGFLVAPASESCPKDNHVHYWYDNQSGQSGYQMKSGGRHFASSFSDYVIQDIGQRLPNLLMK